MIIIGTPTEELEEIRAEFKRLDTTGDGVLSKNEITEGFKNIGIIFGPKEINQIFLHRDRNESGTLEYDEFILGLSEKKLFEKEERIKCIN